MVGKQEKAEQQRGHFNLLGQYSSLQGCTFILLTDSQQEVQEGRHQMWLMHKVSEEQRKNERTDQTGSGSKVTPQDKTLENERI